MELGGGAGPPGPPPPWLRAWEKGVGLNIFGVFQHFVDETTSRVHCTVRGQSNVAKLIENDRYDYNSNITAAPDVVLNSTDSMRVHVYMYNLELKISRAKSSPIYLSSD